jgi:hypothetical protein
MWADQIVALTGESLGLDQVLSICMVKVGDAFASELEMLLLIMPNGDVGCSIVNGSASLVTMAV